MIQAEGEQVLKGDSNVQKRKQRIIHKNSSAVQNKLKKSETVIFLTFLSIMHISLEANEMLQGGQLSGAARSLVSSSDLVDMYCWI